MSSKAFAAKAFAWLRQINRGRYLAIDVRIALELTEYFRESDQGGRAFPSYKTIGDPIGVSEHTVIRAIDRLRKGGHLYVIPGKPGRGHPNQYWMVVKPAEKTCTAMEVFEDVKPASIANKTCTAVQENHCLTTENKKERASRAPKKAHARGPIGSKSGPSKSLFPEGWQPADLTPDQHADFDHFADHARTCARTCADWDAAWRNWQRKSARMQQQERPNGRSLLAAFDRTIDFLGGKEAAQRYVPGSEGPRPLNLDRIKGPNGVRRLPPR